MELNLWFNRSHHIYCSVVDEDEVEEGELDDVGN